jgi:hypothetical protein
MSWLLADHSQRQSSAQALDVLDSFASEVSRVVGSRRPYQLEVRGLVDESKVQANKILNYSKFRTVSVNLKD